MTDQDKAASVFGTLTEPEVDKILDSVDAAVDKDIRDAREAGLGDAGLLVAEWVSRASCRCLNLSKAMQVPPNAIYQAMIAQGLVGTAIDILTTFAEPTAAGYTKFAEAIAQDFLASFAKGASEALKANVKLH